MGWATPRQEPEQAKLAHRSPATAAGAPKQGTGTAPRAPKPPRKPGKKARSGPKREPKAPKRNGKTPPKQKQAESLPLAQNGREPDGDTEAGQNGADPGRSEPGRSEQGSNRGKPVQVHRNRGGRPSKFTPDIVEEICERLCKGEPLACICLDAHMPCPNTVRVWMLEHEGVSEAIARARETGFDALAYEALKIADTPVEGMRRKMTAEGPEIWYEDMLGHRKLQVEARLKLLAKWCPKRYGDKLELSGNPDQPGKSITGSEVTPEYLAEIRERRKLALEGRPRIEEKPADAREVV